MPLLRLVAIVLWLGTGVLVGTALSLLGRTRRRRAVTAWCRLLSRRLLAILRIRLEVSGETAAGALVIANHVSWIDILALAAAADVAFLAKTEVARWPFIGRVAALNGTVFVDRRRKRSIVSTNAAIAEHLGSRRTTVLFAEGTTGPGHHVLRFGSSHVEAVIMAARRDREITLQPATLTYDTPAAAWIGDDALVPHLWRILHRPPIGCRLVFGAPIAVEANSCRKQLTRRAQEVVRSELALLHLSSATGSAWYREG